MKKIKSKTGEPIEYEISSGNVFADLGFPDAEERFAKIALVVQINDLIKKRRLTQAKAAELLDIDQAPNISFKHWTASWLFFRSVNAVFWCF